MSAGFPKGLVGIADSDGHPVGFVPASSIEGAQAFPALDLGTGAYEVTGLRVTDRSGQQVGYFLTWIGFVDNETARDPRTIDDLIAADIAIRAKARAAELELAKQVHQGG